MLRDILDEQIEYYRARAGEYDEWIKREGRYDRGVEHRKRWQEELKLVKSELVKSVPHGAVLELACGTGLWTGSLAARAAHLTAFDFSPEAIAINRAKVKNKVKKKGRKIDYREGDIFSWSWQDEKKYDFIFFGFWLSHVPEELFSRFWDAVAFSLVRGGRVFLVDSLYTRESTAHDHRVDCSGLATRNLNNGSQYRIVKVFYRPHELEARLSRLGWEGRIRRSGKFFMYGCLRAPL